MFHDIMFYITIACLQIDSFFPKMHLDHLDIFVLPQGGLS